MSDYDLKAVVKRIKTKPFNFALIKGSESNQVYLGPKPPTSKQLAPIMDECGDGKRIAKGLCMWENDQLTFATKAAPSGSWEKMTTKIFKENQCAKYLPVVFRQLGEDETDEVSFDETEAAEGEESAAETGNPEELYRALLATLSGDLERFRAVNPGTAEKIQKVVSAAEGLAGKGDFPKAYTYLDQAAKALAKATGEPPAEGKEAGGFEELYHGLLETLPGDLQRLRGSNPATAEKIQKIVDAAAGLAGKGDFQKAFTYLDQAAKALAKVTGDASAAGAQPPTSVSIVQLGKARLEWDPIRLNALSEIQRLKGILLKEYEGDEKEQAAVAAAAKHLDAMIAALNEQLGKKLDDVLKADVAQRPQFVTTAKGLLTRFVNFVQSDKVLSVIDGNEYAPDMVVAAPLRAKLQEIAASLG